MTNYERLKELPPEELAWFLMAYSDHCRCCSFKQVDENGTFKFSQDSCINCNEELKEEGWTCIGGYLEWLQRECITKDDKWMFEICKSNVVVNKWNELPPDQKEGFEIKYENGMAVGLQRAKGYEEEDVESGEIDWITPFPF